jgi:sialate O-acetylesterase
LWFAAQQPGGIVKAMALPATVPADDAAIDPVTRAGLEEFIRIMTYPKVAMAISGDLSGGIHPLNKPGYAHRASDAALGMVYGKKVEYYGPLYESHTVEGNKVRVRFTHVGQGLAFKHVPQLQGFALAGEDKIFHWADASIDGENVVLSSDAVKEPVAVRYGWSVKRVWANLFNKDGLPAIPFRTDSW